MALLRGRSRLRSRPTLALPSPLGALLLAGAAALALPFVSARAASPAHGDQPPAARGTVRLVPPELADESWLERRRTEQARAMQAVSAFHDFQFTDRAVDSGISFVQHIVPDAGKSYKAAHYDHGNGLAMADVDGDGRADLYFVNQIGGNQLWKNLGNGKFQNITATAGVAVAGKVGVSAAFGDVDNDGDDDLFVTTVRGGNMLFENDGQGHFRDISAASGLNYVGHSSSGVFFDYDHDGRLDLLVVNVGRYTSETIATEAGQKYHVAFDDAFSGHLKPQRAEASILYHNDGNKHFTDVTRAMGIRDISWSGDASVVDVNEDGWPDVYLLNMEGDDQYYENQAGQRFLRKSRDVFPRTSWGSMGIKVFDANNDGRMDILVTDMHSDMSDEAGPDKDGMKSDMRWPESFRGDGATSIWGNSFFLKEAPGRFREASDAMNLESYCPWGPSVADLNADGFDDVFIASGMNYPFRYMVNALKLNDGGRRFVDAEFALGIEPRRGGVTTPWFELDASGADKGHRDAQGLTGRLAIWGARGTRSAAILDIDGDGDLDIVTNDFGTGPMVLVSNLSEKTQLHYVEIKLTGSTSNRDGLGAVVKVTAGGTTYTKALDGNSGYLSHSVYPLYFGLAAATAVDRIEVTWPTGRTQTVQPPFAMNSRIEVKEQ